MDFDELLDNLHPGWRLYDWQRQTLVQLQVGDVFVNAPTGRGKALPLQLSPFLFGDAAALVISPLVALSEDFVSSFGPSASLHHDKGSAPTSESSATQRHFIMAPEVALAPAIKAWLASDLMSRRICAIVVDEAYAVLQWYAVVSYPSIILNCFLLGGLCSGPRQAHHRRKLVGAPVLVKRFVKHIHVSASCASCCHMRGC